MHKIKILFLIFLSILLISSLFLTPSVNATSYYNHMQNSSFVSYSDYIEDGGFESGSHDSGVIYGNWSASGVNPSQSTISLLNPNSGVYSILHIYDTVTPSITIYNLTESYYFLGADLISLSLFGWISAGETGQIVLHYEDLTSDNIALTGGASYNQDVFNSSDLNPIKVVVAFEIQTIGNGHLAYYDDVVLLVDDGGGQDLIGANTTPWRRVMDPNIWAFIGLKNDFGRLDNSSAYFYNLGDSGYIIQDINFLDVDFVHFADLYYYVVDPVDMSLQFTVEYDDGSSSNSIKAIDVNSNWTYLNFGKSFIGSNKNIIGISVRIFSGSGSKIVHIDDVGLWASVVAGFSRFEFTVTPSPIGQSSNSLWISTGIQYTMLCYLYDDSGSLSFNGTVKIFDSTGETITTITNGMFSYIIIPRSYVSDTVENFVFQIICDNDNIYTVLLVVIFDYIASDIVTPITPIQTTDFMFLFIFIVIPSMFLAVILKPVGIPIIGFLSGLTIMSAIGRAVGIIDLWFLFVMVLVCVLIILSMIKRGLYT